MDSTMKTNLLEMAGGAKHASRAKLPLTSPNIPEEELIRLGSSTSALRTFELRRDPLPEPWLLQSITGN